MAWPTADSCDGPWTGRDPDIGNGFIHFSPMVGEAPLLTKVLGGDASLSFYHCGPWPICPTSHHELNSGLLPSVAVTVSH